MNFNKLSDAMTPNANSKTQTELGPAVELRAELPFDFAAFISPSVLMAPAYVESPDAAEQLPVLFWLCEAVSPRIIVDVGAADATAYFGLCQTADQLSLDTTCYLGGVALDTDAVESRAKLAQWITQQNDHHGNRSQIIGGNHDNLTEILKKGSVDLLVLHAAGASIDQVRQWKADFLPKLSSHSAVFIDGLGSDSHELFDEFVTLGPSFRFNHGSGFGVVAAGTSPPELLRYLGAQATDEKVSGAVCSLFERLGLGCRQAVDQSHIEQLREQLCSVMGEIPNLREESGLLAARLVGRESEILELRERLGWYQEQADEVRRQLVGSQTQLRRLQEANERIAGQLHESQTELMQSRKVGKRLQIDFDETRIQLGERRRRVKVLRDTNEQLKLQLKKARRSLAKSEEIQGQERRKSEALCGQLEDVHNSRSWKLTAPLRRLIRLLRGR